jgi:hypothetical protein
MAMDKGKEPTQEEQKRKSHGRRSFKKLEGEKKEGGVPLLKYRKGNNFYAFQQALYRKALRDYGDLAKLITLNKYYEPQLDLPDFAGLGLTMAEVTIMQQEALKKHSKLLVRMKLDRPKLYGLILEQMSVESKDEVAQEADYETWHKETDPEKLWQAIIKSHKVDCVSNASQIKELTARKAYQQIKQGLFELLAQFSKRFRETYSSYKNTSTVTNPVNIEEKEQAMDFFHALDAGRYGEFKTSMLNGWAAGAFNPPDTINKIYRTAGTWVKPVPRGERGTAVSNVTIEEGAKQAATKKKQEQQQKQKQQQAAAAAVESETTEDVDKKPPPKDRSNYRCWSCNEFGHLANSKQCPNYKKKSEDKDVNANVTWQEYKASMYMMVRLAEEVNEDQQEFVVNNPVHVTQALEPTKVLLDNQADISIMHPMLLQDVQKSQRRIRVKGVGGPQLIVDEEGVLDGFFPVYASKKTKANVLSFADVEDLYDITYICKCAFIVHMSDRDLVFKRRQKLYIADWGTMGIVAPTIQENEHLYTKEEVSRAKLAYEFVRNSGYPSLGEVVHLITDGNIRNIPKLMPVDVERAYKINGSHPE